MQVVSISQRGRCLIVFYREEDISITANIVKKSIRQTFLQVFFQKNHKNPLFSTRVPLLYRLIVGKNGIELTGENKAVLLIVCVAKYLGERSLWLYEKVG